LLGDSAGFVNVPRIKGSHNAIRSGILAADAAYAALAEDRSGDVLEIYDGLYQASDIKKELNLVRNAKPLLTRLGTRLGTLAAGIDMTITNLTGGFSPLGTLKHKKTDAASTGLAADYQPIVYPKPDGVLSFDKLSSVFMSNTNHDEDQPAHLKLRDPSIPVAVNLPKYGEPARLYCPAGVYEVLRNDDGTDPRFVINAQNCVHCKTCDIKDPSQNIVWTTPEGGGGPNYPNM
jgi:electron-transferring-flavoprotein dehydrogenase